MTEPIAARYRRFAAAEAHGHSALYEAFATGVAGDAALLSFLAELPAEKQQPNLLFAAARLACGPAVSFADFRQLVLDHGDVVRAVMLRRRTQTNEAARCAALLPVLAGLPGPLALIEVGASGGLCLLPDRYGYDYGDVVLPGDPVLPCRATGVALPDGKPEIAWRRGLDLHPVDVTDADQVAWLEALVWPDQPERLSRLRRAVAVARADPPMVLRGDLRTDTLPLIEEARRFGTAVVFHTAVLAYLPDAADRLAFGQDVMRAKAVWISNEAPGVLQEAGPVARMPPRKGAFLLSVNGVPAAWTDPHGGWIESVK